MGSLFFFLSLISLGFLVFGMFKPGKVFLGAESTRGKVGKVYGFGFLVLFIAFVIALPKTSENDMPQSQAEFFKISKEYAKMYDSAGDNGATAMQRELTEKKSVENRNKALQQFQNFENWEVTVKDVKMNNFMDHNKVTNFAELITQFGSKYGVGNLVILVNSDRNALGVSDNVIIEGSPLYNILLGLKEDQKILVSGKFWKRDNGEIFEKSLTESGGIRSPEFVVTYTDIKIR